MPVGNPKPQTVATRKYEAKAGWISKSYKLKADRDDECFCERSTRIKKRRRISEASTEGDNRKDVPFLYEKICKSDRYYSPKNLMRVGEGPAFPSVENKN